MPWKYTVEGACRSWKPREECHTLSVAVTEREEKWAAGGILRSDTGSPILMFTLLLGKSDCRLAVLQAWERGLSLTREMDLGNLTRMVIDTSVEDDHLEKEINEPTPKDLYQILDKVDNKVDRVYLYTLTRIKRLLPDMLYKEVRVITVEANKVAIKLAEMGRADAVTFQLFGPQDLHKYPNLRKLIEDEEN
ncbi:hypothetical protein ACS0TY_000526 [Phlomoides rotata]